MFDQEQTYYPADPRLRSPHPSTYTFHPLPAPSSQNAIVRVSMIPTSTLTRPKEALSRFSQPGEKETLPSWSFLIEHGDEAMLWDLGMREDPENSTKFVVNGPLKEFQVYPGAGPIKRLEEGGPRSVPGFELMIVWHTCDMDTLPQPAPPILMGGGTLATVGKGAPEDPDSPWPSSWIKRYHMVELPIKGEKNKPLDNDEIDEKVKEKKWEKLGCFEHAIDWYGDGSLWFIDTPGHAEGHLMALTRVTYDLPTYILLTGDAAHHQTQYLPVPTSTNPEDDKRSPLPVIKGKPQLAIDPPVLAKTIGQMTRMSAEENVLVVMAHEKEVNGILPVFPQDLSEWKQAGWKEKEAGLH